MTNCNYILVILLKKRCTVLPKKDCQGLGVFPQPINPRDWEIKGIDVDYLSNLPYITEYDLCKILCACAMIVHRG